MLKEYEVLWEKPITPLVASILKSGGGIATEPDVRKVCSCIVLYCIVLSNPHYHRLEDENSAIKKQLDAEKASEWCLHVHGAVQP